MRPKFAVQTSLIAGAIAFCATISNASEQAFAELVPASPGADTGALLTEGGPMCIDFEPGSARLDQVDKATLRGKARWMRRHPGAGLFIVGYSDETGNSAQDRALGLARADAVRRFLVAQGANPHALRPVEARQVGRTLASFRKSASALSRPVAALVRSPRPASRPARRGHTGWSHQ